MKRNSILRLALAMPFAFALASMAHGQGAKDYPARSVRLVAPFASGSTSDTSARFVAEQLTKTLGHSFVVDNQPGADGRLGMMVVKNAPADGYTLVQGSWTNLAVNPVLIKGLPYDPLKDFKPIGAVGRSMLGIAVPRGSRFNTLQDLLTAARDQPTKLNFGNFGTGYRLAIEWISSLSGARFTHVPYKATSQMNTDLVGGQLDAAMDGVTSMASLVKSGQLKLLAVTGDARHPAFPDVPTVKETYPDMSIYGWSALMVRAETPDDITEKLGDAIYRIMGTEDAKVFAQRVGSDLLQLRPSEIRTFQAGQIDNFRKVADAAGLQAE